MACATSVVVGQVGSGAMRMTRQARWRRGPLHDHAWLAGNTVAGGAGATRGIHLAGMGNVRVAQESRTFRLTPPCDRAGIGPIMTFPARGFRGHRCAGVARRDATVTTLAKREEPLVTFVRECRGWPALRMRDGCTEDQESKHDPHCLLSMPVMPGSRPTVQSKRNVKRRWLQSGDGAPFVRWWE